MANAFAHGQQIRNLDVIVFCDVVFGQLFRKVEMGMDMATLEFLTDEKMYELDFKTQNNNGSQKKSGAEMVELWKDFCPN